MSVGLQDAAAMWYWSVRKSESSSATRAVRYSLTVYNRRFRLVRALVLLTVAPGGVAVVTPRRAAGLGPVGVYDRMGRGGHGHGKVSRTSVRHDASSSELEPVNRIIKNVSWASKCRLDCKEGR
jgi:hypothetical protein